MMENNASNMKRNLKFQTKYQPKMLILSHQVGTVMDAQEVMVLITGVHKSFALHKAIEEGVNHMWTVSAFQQHPNTLMVCDENATLELKVKTVKYFKGLMEVHSKLIHSY